MKGRISADKQAAKPAPGNSDANRPHAKGSSTRDLILITAEKLFAEFGISTVSLRDIGAAAGQKNNVVVQYHFGSRENLLKEIGAYRSAFVETVRADLLAEVLAGEKPPEIADFVRAFVASLASNITAGNHFLPFMSRYVIEQDGYTNLKEVQSTGTVIVLKDILHRLLPDYPDVVIEERWQIVMTSAIHMLASYQTALKSRTVTASLDHLIDDLVRFLTAGLQAPPGPKNDA